MRKKNQIRINWIWFQITIPYPIPKEYFKKEICKLFFMPGVGKILTLETTESLQTQLHILAICRRRDRREGDCEENDHPTLIYKKKRHISVISRRQIFDTQHIHASLDFYERG